MINIEEIITKKKLKEVDVGYWEVVDIVDILNHFPTKILVGKI